MPLNKPRRDAAPAVAGTLLSIDSAILENLPTAVCVCDANGTIVRYNRRAAAMWGRTPRDGDTHVQFFRAFRFYGPGGRPIRRGATPMAQTMTTGRAQRDREMIVERPDGGRLRVLASVDPVLDAGGALNGAIGAFLDITDRTPPQRTGPLSNAGDGCFRSLLDALPAAIYATDAEGRITFYNEAAAVLWGHRPQLGTSHWCGSWRLYWPDGRPLSHDQCPMAVTLRENREVRGVEAVAERPDGVRVPFMPYPILLRDPSGAVAGAVNLLVDITAAKQAEERRQRLIDELNHRVKNMLATVQSIAAQSFGDNAASAAPGRFEERLMALSKAHDVLTRENWEGASLHEILSQAVALACSGEDTRLDTSGPHLRLPPRLALPLALAFHELCTNAIRFGALSGPTGRVAVRWCVVPGGNGRRLSLQWEEQGGPPVAMPGYRGFGSRLIESGLAHELDAEIRLDYARTGLVCEIDAPLS